MQMLSIVAAALLTVATVNAAAPVQAQTAPAASLTLAFAGIETPTGMILVSVFDSEAAYNGGKPVRGAAIPATAAAVETLLEGLPAGRYAIKAFHDVDGNGQMAVNPFGMPSEPFAFSNDAIGNMGPATWAQAAFDVAPGAARHTIKIR